MKLNRFYATTAACLLVVVTHKFVLPPYALWAQSSSVIDATVKISVCGNGVQEGGEDCDYTDLAGKSCAMLGYAGGTLQCDYSCSFDLDLCLATTPTPVPIANPTPSPVPSPTATPTPTPSDSPSSSTTLAPSPTVIPQASPTVRPTMLVRSSALPRSIAAPSLPIQTLLDEGKTAQQAALPLHLTLFDQDNSGRIEKKEVYTSVKLWVDEWQHEETDDFSRLTEPKQDLVCDFNNDKICSVKDFSLLMYYVAR